MIENSSSMDRPVTVPSGFTRPRVIAAAAVALLLVAGAIAFPSIRRWARADRSIDATTLGTGVVTRGDLRREISVQGRVVASLHPTLVAQASGIVSLRAKGRPGREQRRGARIIDSPELRSTLEQARAQSLSAQADAERQKIVTRQSDTRLREEAAIARTKLEAARRELVRAETLHKEGLYSAGDYEKAQDGVHVAELEFQQATSEIGLTKESGDFDVRTRVLQAERQQAATTELEKRYDSLTIRAPFSGMIASLAVNDRDAVTTNQPILNIVNLSSLELELQIPEEYANETKIGTTVSISFGNGEQPGHITAVSPEVVNNQLTARAVPDGGWPPGMKQNQRATVRLVFESKRGVLKVPRGAWLDAGGGHTAYVVDSGSATRRAITVGSISISEVEIASGLREGERIIVSDTSSFGDARTVILH